MRVDRVAHEGLLVRQLLAHALFEAVHDALQYRLIEDEPLAPHDAHHVVVGEQFATLERDAVGPCVEHIDP